MPIEPYVADLFARVGAIADLYAVDAYESEGLWHIAVDAETFIFAEWVAERRIVVLSADLGAPRGEAKQRFHELALIYNAGWTESGGLRLALNAKGGAILLLDWAPAQAAERELAAVLRQFTGAASAWREALEKGPASLADALSETHFHMIRI